MKPVSISKPNTPFIKAAIWRKWRKVPEINHAASEKKARPWSFNENKQSKYVTWASYQYPKYNFVSVFRKWADLINKALIFRMKSMRHFRVWRCDEHEKVFQMTWNENRNIIYCQCWNKCDIRDNSRISCCHTKHFEPACRHRVTTIIERMPNH